MTFPLGKPILVMLTASVLAGAIILFRGRDNAGGDLLVWTFADSHARSFRGDRNAPPAVSVSNPPTSEPTLVQQYEAMTGRKVNVVLMSGAALNVRMNAIIDRTKDSGAVPDLVEIEISSIGRYFRPPLKHVGFLPLNELLEQSGAINRLVKMRLAPWTKSGQVFGIPHDVHPVTITFRRDLFEEAGIDLPSAQTWPEFQEKCLEFQAYWRAHGQPNRRALELPSASAEYIVVMLLQRHLNVLDTENRSYLTDPRVAQAMSFYAHCVAGPRRIAGDATPGPNMWIRDASRGDLAAFFTPDWRADYLSATAPQLAGKMAMMPLPIFEPGDAPTGTWGGTMIAIPRQARDTAQSWKLAEFLYLSPQAMQSRKHIHILPAAMDGWSDPLWHQPDPYFSNQKIGELQISLAQQLPARYVTPFSPLATQGLSLVLNRAVLQLEGGDETNLDANIMRWLKDADVELNRRIAFGKFEE